MPSSTRRSVLVAILGLTTTAGCTERNRGGEALAKVSEPPDDVDPLPYPQSELENTYITDAINKAISNADEQGWWSVEVPPEDFPDVENTYEQLKQNGHNPYVTYEGTTLELSISKYE